jgi:plastocyanin
MAEIKIVPGQGRAVFSPDPVAIAKNTRVFWLNDDNQNHQISLTGEVLKPGETSSEVVITADRTYSCMLHPNETGTIETTDAVA